MGRLLSILADDYPHPVVSSDGRWIGIVILIIAGLILAAAVIGPIVRANAPEDLPQHSHDEPETSSSGEDVLRP